MFEKTDETVELVNDIETEASDEVTPEATTGGYSEPLSTGTIPDPPLDGDYGMFNNALISVENGVVNVFIPFNSGSNTTKVPVPLAAAWIVDNLAGSLLSEAKKHKP